MACMRYIAQAQSLGEVAGRKLTEKQNRNMHQCQAEMSRIIGVNRKEIASCLLRYDAQVFLYGNSRRGALGERCRNNLCLAQPEAPRQMRCTSD